MNVVLPDAAAIVARLREAPGFRAVGGAADLATAYAAPQPAVPAAYVVMQAESGSANALANDRVEQRVAVRFAVVIAARNVADATGLAVAAEMVALRQAVMELLLGWLPAWAIAGCEYVRGALADFNAGLMWWQDEFSTEYLLRSE
ncbi:MAG: hypothetical protein KA265_20155 [Piscinibacter sp.]|nr:hypothetical protein [Piscinibacter sp.]